MAAFIRQDSLLRNFFQFTFFTLYKKNGISWHKYFRETDSCSSGQNLSIFNTRRSRVSTAWQALKIQMKKIAYMHGEYRQIYSAVDI